MPTTRRAVPQHVWRPPFWLLLAALAAWLGGAPRASTAADPLDRVQLHRNPNRGVPYLPLAEAHGEVGPPVLVVRPARTIELDGFPLANAYSNLRPIDVDGDGSFEFVQYNGYRFMQLWDAAGRKLWRVGTADGRLHDYQDGTQRDTVAVLDLDGDGKQDVAHCWAMGGERRLVYRRGLDGKVLRHTRLDGGVNQECQIAAFRFAGPPRPLLLVAQSIQGTAARACPRNWVGYWARVAAFDLAQRQVWARDTCDAGHYAWPLDEDRDGAAEAVYVGKHLLRADGHLQCSLATWPKDDHVDGMAIADFDPLRPGLEAAVVGRTGTALFSAASCQEIWRVPTTVIRDPQHVAAARLDDLSPTPVIVVDERGSVPRSKTFVVDGGGRILAATTNPFMPMQNAELDGGTALEEMVGSWGRVIDRFGNFRLDRGWYWNLKGTKVQETTAGPYPTNYDRWQAFPLVFDQDGDGKDEIVQWGQSLIVVGKVENAVPPLPAPVTDRLFWLRYVASYPDLIASLGPDPEKAVAHYRAQGRAEGRAPVFDPLAYVARNPWLRAAFATDPAGATAHYITTGYGKGFTFSDTPLRWLSYVASYPELIQRFGTLASGGELDWLTAGQAAGRVTTFDPVAYLRATPAARTACGTNLLCVTRHYIEAARAAPTAAK